MATDDSTDHRELEEDIGLKKQLNSQSYPWLFIQDYVKHRILFYSVSNKKYYKNIISEMEYKNVWLSFYGWLILQDTIVSENFSLFNPITLENIQLPCVDGECDACFLSSPPRDSNCHVLFMDGKDRRNIFFCRLGDAKFTKQELDFHAINFGQFEGKLYCIYISESDELLGEISFQGFQLQLTPLTTKRLDVVRHNCPHYYYDYLIECSGELLLVHKQLFGQNYEVNGMLVFKFDFVNKDWIEIKDIGKYTIFLSRNVGVASKATELGVKPNSIYIVSPTTRYLQVYNLENGRISTTLPCPTANRFSRLHWIIPETNKLNHHIPQDSSFD